MPLTPKEALKAKAEREQPRLDMLYKRIDSALVGGNYTISVSGQPHSVADAAVATYRALGWKVQYIHDQRDGDYLQFTLPKE